MRLADEKGVALIMVLIMMGVISVLAASLIFVSQTETWASQNYRLMSEARYGAESGVHKAANFLHYAYVAPTGTEITTSGFTITTSPVRYGTDAVQLASSGAQNCVSNYPPLGTVASAFASGAHGTLTGGYVVTYDACATLMSMRQVDVYGSATKVTVQTWRIVGTGSIGGAKPAQVDVEAIIEQQVSPMFKYAAFADYDGCGSLKWAGGGKTDSYDSSSLPPVYVTTDANVGTNGNLTEVGSTTIIGGSLSTPRTGIGNCSAGNVTAWTLNGNGQVTGGVIELPQPVTYPTPDVFPPGTTDISVPKTGVGNNIIKSPGDYANITINGTLHLTNGGVDASGNPIPGVYNINSLNMPSNGATLYIDSGPVILNVAGYTTPSVAANCQIAPLPSSCKAIPFDMTGGAEIVNASLNPSMLRVQYAGTGEMRLAGGSASAALIYAPNAATKLVGGSAWWGAIIGQTVDNSGGVAIHYDRRLGGTLMMVGPWMMNSFSWQRF